MIAKPWRWALLNMTEFTEGLLQFYFGEPWQILKYDDCALYRNQLQKNLTDTKAVDFVGIGPDGHEGRLTAFYLIEVKDYRTESKPRTIGDVAETIAKKVRDTLAGLIALHRAEGMPKQWTDILTNAQNRIYVVLWSEEPIKNQQQLKTRASQLSKRLRQKLRWLNATVLVVGKSLGTGLPALDVHNLPHHLSMQI